MAEVKLPNGTWPAFSAACIPQILDDEIKGYYAHFFMAATKFTPDEFKDVIPMAVPMTHHFEGSELIAKYPVDQWEAAGAQDLSERGW